MNMATKRPADDQPSGSSGPPNKKLNTRFDPVNIGPVYSLEALDVKVLQFQNKKLGERIEQRKRAEDELRKRIEQLENRQRTDDAVLMIVNRYWNQLDEDVRVLLQRFDAETADEIETKNESEELTAFLTLLSTWDKQELEQKLGQRVEFSKRAIGKLLQAFDRLLQRNEKLNIAIQGKIEKEDEDNLTLSGVRKESEIKKENEIKKEPEMKKEIEIKKEPTEEGEDQNTSTTSMENVEDKPSEEMEQKTEEQQTPMEPPAVKMEEEVIKEEPKEEPVEEVQEQKPELPSLRETVKVELTTLQKENRRLHNQVTNLHQRHHDNTLKVAELQDKLTAAETEIAELKNQIDDLEYNLGNSQQRAEKLDRHLSEAYQKLHNFDEKSFIPLEGGKGISGVPKNRFEEMIHEIEEQREMATNRMTELEKLTKDHQEALMQIEQLKMDLQHLPEHVIVETTEYKCLQSQFSVLYNDNMQIRTQLEESRNLLKTSKNTHLRQVEQMEGDELDGQKKLRGECIQLEDALAQVRKEYEMLRIEFEQTLAQNEQTGPINHEMRNLIQSLQRHNQQLKAESSRYRRRMKDHQNELNKLKAEGCISDHKMESNGGGNNSSGSACSDASAPPSAPQAPPTPPILSSKPDVMETSNLLSKEEEKEEIEYREKGQTDADVIKELRSQLKSAQASQKELKLLLDMYKSAPKEQRDKVQLMAGEKKARQEIDDLKSHIKKMQEAERKERRKLAEEDAIRKIQKMEITITETQKNLSAQKQREEVLLSEMESTGQAFEEMQEQNTRLLQQLKEKDDANFKLMSERIKSNQIQKLLREEKEVLVDQVGTLQAQVEAQNLVVRKLEEKEQILQNTLSTVEKELGLTQQAMELHKRKAVESSQTAADLKLHLDKYQAQLKETQVSVAEKTSALEQESFKYKRMQEEIAKLQRKLERTKKIEMAGAADEVLMAEIQEYKDQLTCPSCKVNRKDAVLTKCFHVFCLECLKTRYETRQRKCPKCNAGFGANDYHRLYLA